LDAPFTCHDAILQFGLNLRDGAELETVIGKVFVDVVCQDPDVWML